MRDKPPSIEEPPVAETGRSATAAFYPISAATAKTWEDRLGTSAAGFGDSFRESSVCQSTSRRVEQPQ